MTSLVRIHAHCVATKEVHVTVLDDGIVVDSEFLVLQDGEVGEKNVFDAREIVVREVTKE